MANSRVSCMADISPLLALPDDCLHFILKRVATEDEYDLESLSLVCKRLLTITNGLKRSLAVTSLMVYNKVVLHRLFLRFSKVKQIITKGHVHDLNDVLVESASAGLDIESLDLIGGPRFPLWGLHELGSKVKSLRVRTGEVGNDDLVLLGEFCPYIEELGLELYLRYPQERLKDTVSTMLSNKLRYLQKLDMSNCPDANDNCLIAFSTNCVFLREIRINNCELITPKGVALAIQNTRNLSSLSLGGNPSTPSNYASLDVSFLESFTNARNLCDIELCNLNISDPLLEAIAIAQRPLKKLALFKCTGITANGILKALSKCKTIEYLTLDRLFRVISDDHVISFSKLLPDLKSINLSWCSNLTRLSFFGLIENCYLLKEINMTWCTNLHGVNFGRFLSIFPRLEKINISWCKLISEEEIVSILRICPELKHLDISSCKQIMDFELDFDVPKLKVIDAERSGLNDKILTTISSRCRRLSYLNLRKCQNVTTKGMRDLLNNCSRALRTIDARFCNQVDGDFCQIIKVHKFRMMG